MTYRKHLTYIALMLFSSNSLANDEALDLTLGLSLSHETNPQRVSENEESDTRGQLSGNLKSQSSGPWYSLSLDYQSAYDDYSNGAYDSQVSTNGQGTLILGRPTLQWYFQNSERKTRLDAIAPDTLDNQSQRSSYSTGPTLNWRIGARDTLSGEYRHSVTTVEDSTSDSERSNYGLTWVHNSSKKLSAGLSVKVSEITPDGSEIDIEKTQLAINIDRRILDGAISLSLGRAKLDSDSLDTQEHNEATLSFKQNYGMQNLRIEASRKIVDSGTGGTSPESELPEPVLLDMFEEDVGAAVFEMQERDTLSASLSSILGSPRTGITLNAAKIETRGLISESGVSVALASVSIRHNLSESASLYTNISQIEFDSQQAPSTLNIGRKERKIQIGYDRSFGKSLSFDCYVDSVSSTGKDFDLYDYDANAFACALNFEVF